MMVITCDLKACKLKLAYPLGGTVGCWNGGSTEARGLSLMNGPAEGES